jgi:D-alanyl-D-alanine carboxypeptidase/D-alanyl-D-alanine-endopeptidase (penicillin-binding protein 4)
VRLRAAALLCVAIAAACVVFGLRTDGSAAATPRATPMRHVNIFSARRAPEVFGSTIARARLDRDIRTALGSTPACVAVDDSGGANLARVQADQPFTPASTIKLLTGIAAIARLGPDAHLTTRIVRGKTPDSIIVVGGNDPTLATSAFAADRHATPRWRTTTFTPVTRIADAIAATGVRNIPTLGVDDSHADTLRYLPDWKPNYGTDGELGSLGALAIDGGFSSPSARTQAGDPALVAGATLAELLRARGVTVGNVARVRAGDGDEEVGHIDSPTLATVVGDMVRASDDFAAEEITRALGDDGTTTSGTRAIVGALEKLGVSMQDATVLDGSGLAPGDRLTCSTLLRVVALLAGPRFAAVDHGLPIAAQTGTLATRFAGSPLAGRLRAKTGTLDNVVGLAGVIDDPTNERFALLANGNFSLAGGQALQEAVMRPIAAAPAQRAAASALVPKP